MTNELLLAMLRANLEQPSPTVNDYLLNLIDAAKESIEATGIWLTDTARDRNLVVMYAAYLYRKRKADNPKGEDKMPRMLRIAINDRLVAEKGGGDMMDSGTCKIYTVTDAAENGEMPNPTLHAYGDYEWAFEDRMISYSRQYAAMGVDQQIDRIIRIWRTPVRIGDVAVVTDRYETGAQYRINNVQPTLDDDGLEVTDLTLRRLEANYDIAEH